MSWDVIVIGCGGFGSASMRELSLRGLRVLGIDRFSPPHDRGSSHGETRIIRKAYFEHPDYVPLLHRSWDLWQSCEETSGRSLLVRCDLVMSGEEQSEVISGARESARQHGLPIENLSVAEACRRYPVLDLPESHVVTVESTAGYLFVEQCVETMLRQAVSQGATLKTHETVLGISGNSTSVEVTTTHGRYSAGALVVTLGAWTGQLLPEYAPLITVRRKTLFWHALQSAAMAELWKSPMFLVDLPHGQFYGLPAVDGARVKVGEHTGGDIVPDPATVSRYITDNDRIPVATFVRNHLRGLNATESDAAVCLYSMSPDGHFLFDRHPQMPIIVAAGFSGHGFKFTPVLAEAAADLLLQGQTRLPVGFLSARRFS